MLTNALQFLYTIRNSIYIYLCISQACSSAIALPSMLYLCVHIFFGQLIKSPPKKKQIHAAIGCTKSALGVECPDHWTLYVIVSERTHWMHTMRPMHNGIHIRCLINLQKIQSANQSNNIHVHIRLLFIDEFSPIRMHLLDFGLIIRLHTVSDWSVDTCSM